ncbi:hypothetical protein HPB51_026029 [Rhipicephalus microplus]|uniref:Ectonucleotide pyrophosphatase/phosphodiesterase family member 3 n=1 Tax=Rhipicephalus microplus TaxID=6941 RepID=A0A9J6EEY3_RHIMP|nr:hypothetical protein HPB51_026029 [Rhipicephalus microplus]
MGEGESVAAGTVTSRSKEKIGKMDTVTVAEVQGRGTTQRELLSASGDGELAHANTSCLQCVRIGRSTVTIAFSSFPVKYLFVEARQTKRRVGRSETGPSVSIHEHDGYIRPSCAGFATGEFRFDMEEDQRPPMWSWKRILVVCLLAVALLVSSFLGGYFHGLQTGKRTRDQQGNISEELFDSEWQRLPCVTEDDVCPEGYSEPPLILISLDGFRADYLSRGLNPSLERLAQCGVKAPFMRPVFPTKTFPNHFTIVTGLWPESHGIVDNKMYDPEFKTLFRIGNIESYNGRWWEAEPRACSREHSSLLGAFATPVDFAGKLGSLASRAADPNVRCSRRRMIPWQTRVEVLLAWLDLPAERRPSLLTLYVNEPDSAGHDHGPHSAAVDEALELVEIMLDRLMAGLQERRLLGCVNLLVVSDHGECMHTYA